MKIDLKDISLNLTNYCLASCKYCTLHNPKNWDLDNEISLSQLETNLLSDPLLGT